ncbi:ribose-phosphate diphosphokinase [Cytophagaceae bacterium YF14B1]|uniref:ribose-phosphate diphosphokinase n=1 Tax=Xanthocytophaga flava TaxID=3048013 RepID=A0AAE3QPN7_9BACT|nr:ribose-phosphate diphosphokinase [Xanthocytophaga flavus]MDJ1483177.1 ribose-phosphate diphosphokinase [Xanthocytophaga flavus]
MHVNKIIFSTQAYQYLQKELCHTTGFECGEVEVKNFPDGERYQRILTSVDCREVVLIGGTISDADTLELFDLAYSLVSMGAESLLLMIPYFGYATMERSVKKGEVVTAKTRAFLLSKIPASSMGNRVFLLDLHTEGVPYYFEGKTRPVHLYAKPTIMEACREIAGNDFVLASTDAGRAKWVESLANDMNVNGAFVFKRRISGDETQITSISADVRDKYVIIYDDMIRTGGSLINAARAYKEAGATKIAAVTTHGLFSKDGLEKIKASGLFECVVSTDSHPNAVRLQGDFLRVKSIASLFRQEIEKH